jgi:hypothetical protein
MVFHQRGYFVMTERLNDPDPSPPSDQPQPVSRSAADRVALDEVKRRQIVRLVALGNSRRTAARVVGCAPSTITRAAARDPQFAAELAHAEETRLFSSDRR